MNPLDPSRAELEAFLSKLGATIAKTPPAPQRNLVNRVPPPAGRGQAQSRASDLLAPCEDGQRTGHLTRLAGWYYSLGLTEELVIAHCMQWNARNTIPLDDDKVIRTCESIGATDARNHPDREAASPFVNGPITPLFDLAQATISNYLTNRPPRRRWVLDEFLPLGIVGAIVSPGGSGKSQFLMQLAYSVATGVQLAGHWTVSEPGTVLMLCAEDGDDEVHRRVHRIHEQLGGSLTAAQKTNLVDRLFIRSVVGEDVLMTRVAANNEAVKTVLVDRLALTVKQVEDLKVIIVDPASRFRGGDENSNPHATRFVQALEALAMQTGATVLIAHHTNKAASYGGGVSQHSSRGASALTDGIRLQLALTPISSSKAEGEAAEQNLLQLSVVKTNYTRAPLPVVFSREADGYLQAASNSPAAFARDSTLLLELLRVIDQPPGGLTARQIETRYCGPGKAINISQRDCRILIQRARDQQFLEPEKNKPLKLTASGRTLLTKCANVPKASSPNGPKTGAAGAARQRRTPRKMS